MFYYITNLGTTDILIGYVRVKAGTEKKVSANFVSANWTVLESLQTTGAISISSQEEKGEEDISVLERVIYVFEDGPYGDGSPLVINHDRSKIPLVQVLDLINESSDIYQVIDENYEANYTGGTDSTCTIIHVDMDTTHIYTEAEKGMVVMLF